jgi:hypothetical protein
MTRWRAAVRRAAQIVAAAHQVAQPFGLRVGRRDEDELAGAEQPDQLLRVAAVGLDPVAGADRHQRRRDHVAADADPGQQPQQVEPARARLVADRQPVRAAEPVDEPADRALGRLDPVQLRGPARRRQRRRDDRELMHIERDPQPHLGRLIRANVRHGLVLLRMRHWPRRASTPAKLTRETCERRGPARNLGVHTDYLPRK